MKARLILADDHQVVRQGLRAMIARCPDLEVVAEAVDGLEAERLARCVPADLLVLDIALPSRRGIQVLESLRADGIALPILFFSMYPASQYVDYARRAGAQGFVGKDANTTELLHAVRAVLRGRLHFPRPATRSGPAPEGDGLQRLSRRELEVMQGLVAGTSIVDIAQALGITTQTVTTYRRRLLEKLGIASNAELATYALRHDAP